MTQSTGRLALTPTEERVLLRLRSPQPGWLVTTDDLVRSVWGCRRVGTADGYVVRNHIHQLRRKLAGTGWRIDNRPGFGYRLVQENA